MRNQSARRQSRIGVLLPDQGRLRAPRGLSTCQITLGRLGTAVSVNYPCMSSRSRSWLGWWPKKLADDSKNGISYSSNNGSSEDLALEPQPKHPLSHLRPAASLSHRVPSLDKLFPRRPTTNALLQATHPHD
ncbi:hypothetical protein L13192_09123 [Pyrenophora tritici-repentis]|nr:hypothetical protein L13192_09123 [Pyrenophora tritici-repentis]